MAGNFTPYMMVATGNYCTLLGGFLLRRRSPKTHGLLMALAIASDLTLVAILEIQRDAVAEALSFKLSIPNQAHILCSSVATALYFPLIFLGVLLLRRSDPSGRMRAIHGKLGGAALLFRSLGFLLMFSMLGLHQR